MKGPQTPVQLEHVAEATATSAEEPPAAVKLWGLCATCRYWASPELLTNQSLMLAGFGECRRRAPTGMSFSISTPGDKQQVALVYPFPPTPPGDWCGEYTRGSPPDAAIGQAQARSQDGTSDAELGPGSAS